jgi:DNA-binding NarL/FixJ family response regulator
MLTTMLVEDNAPFREMVRDDILSRFSSINVIEASNGEEAFKGLASYPIDLTFMDIGLQGQNGLVLTQKIKSDNQDDAVVMLSGYDSDEYRKAALQSGANGFIGKDSADLMTQISTVVSCFHGAKEAGRSKPGCLLV